MMKYFTSLQDAADAVRSALDMLLYSPGYVVGGDYSLRQASAAVVCIQQGMRPYKVSFTLAGGKGEDLECEEVRYATSPETVGVVETHEIRNIKIEPLPFERKAKPHYLLAPNFFRQSAAS